MRLILCFLNAEDLISCNRKTSSKFCYKVQDLWTPSSQGLHSYGRQEIGPGKVWIFFSAFVFRRSWCSCFEAGGLNVKRSWRYSCQWNPRLTFVWPLCKEQNGCSVLPLSIVVKRPAGSKCSGLAALFGIFSPLRVAHVGHQSCRFQGSG